MKKRGKQWLIAGGIVLAVFACIFLALTNGLAEGARLPIDGVDLSGVPDGSYTGTYKFKRWSNTVIVHVKDHEIISIDLEPDPTGIVEELVRRVIEKQDTKVDAVAGATVSSKAYLKAIENALED